MSKSTPLPEIFTCMVCGWEGASQEFAIIGRAPKDDAYALGCPGCKCSGHLWSPDQADKDAQRTLEALKIERERRGIPRIPENLKPILEKMRRNVNAN